MTFENPGVPDLLASLRAALDSPEPLEFLSAASAMLSVVDPVPNPLASLYGDEESLPAVTLDEFLDTFLSMPTNETDSLLVACAEILGDADLQATVQSEVKPRMEVISPWLAELPRLRVRKAAAFGSVLGGEETIALEAAGPRGGFTLMISVAKQGTPFIEDAYGVFDTVDDLIGEFKRQGIEGLTIEDLTLKEARGRIEDALETTDMTVPPVETDSWPATRPLLKWQLRGMPEGGEGYPDAEWSDEQIDALTEDFVSSPHASHLPQSERELASLFINLALSYGSGSPLQWNPSLIERFLLDLVPRKVHYPRKDLRAIPRVLSAFVAYSNEALEVPDTLANYAQDLIEELTPLYLQAINPKTRKAAEPWRADFMESIASFLLPDPLTLLVDEVGGEEALDALDADPLPTGELFDVGDVPEDVRDRVEKIGDLVSTHASQFFADPEMVTAAHRTLLLVATENPEVFRRRSKDLNTAAAILFITGHNNRWITRNDPDRSAAALWKTVGVSPVPWDRAFNMLKELPTQQTLAGDPSTFALGRPELLTSTRRAAILREKKSLEEMEALE